MGEHTLNQFFYKPFLGARGTAEKSSFDSGLDQVDARLGKEIWLGDPDYASLSAALGRIGGAAAILQVPAGVVEVADDTQVPGNITLVLYPGAKFQVPAGVNLQLNGPVHCLGLAPHFEGDTGAVVSINGPLLALSAPLCTGPGTLTTSSEPVLISGLAVSGDITVGGTVDGVDVAHHQSRHEKDGADALPHDHLSGAGARSHAEIDSHLASMYNPHSVTKAQVGLGDVSNDAQLKRGAGDFQGFTEKVTPDSGDLILLEDSADSFTKKKVQVGNLPGGGNGSTFLGLADTPGAYSGYGGKTVRVNSAQNALEFGGDDHQHSNKGNLDSVNQNLGTGQAPAFAGLTVTGDISISGTVDGVDVSAHAADVGVHHTHINKTNLDAINQNLGAAASPTFAGLTINGDLAVTGTVDGVAVAAHAARHLAGAADALAGNLDANARVQIRADGNPVGARRSLNFMAGDNVSLSLIDNPAEEVVNIAISASGGAHPTNPQTVPGVAGEALAAFDLCYVGADGRYWRAAAGSTATMPGLVLAGSACSAGQEGAFIRRGQVTNELWSWGTVGGFVYASLTAGGLTQTAPSGSGEQLQIVGIALSATKIDFDPQLLLVEVA
jgi:hypothetical protein